jgi:hypothetical protein
VTVTTGSPALSGNLGGQTASFFATTPTQNVTFSSDFLTFANTTERNFALSFSNITPQLSLGPGGFFDSFTAAGTGTFASSPRPLALAPTAAAVSLSGRVTVGKNGEGLRNAVVVLTDSSGNSRQVITGTFGYYRFDEVAVGETYFIGVQSKRYFFESQVIHPTDDVGDLDFSAQP